VSNSGIKGARASYASLEKQMDAYDRLPPSVRAALAGAAFNWAAFPIRRWFESDRYTAKELIKRIGAWDRNQIIKDRTQVWGLPVARAPRIRQRRSFESQS
jgi:hypothetical protein